MNDVVVVVMCGMWLKCVVGGAFLLLYGCCMCCVRLLCVWCAARQVYGRTSLPDVPRKEVAQEHRLVGNGEFDK